VRLRGRLRLVAHERGGVVDDALTELVGGDAQAPRPAHLLGERPELIGDLNAAHSTLCPSDAVALEVIDRRIRELGWRRRHALVRRHEQHLRTLYVDGQRAELIDDDLILPRRELGRILTDAVRGEVLGVGRCSGILAVLVGRRADAPRLVHADGAGTELIVQ